MTHQLPLFVNDKRRKRPYVWVTWLTKLLAGEHSCLWRSWYKACFKYTKRPDDPGRAAFFEEWTAKHDAISTARAEELRQAGWVVREEEAAAFKLKGKAGDLAGKPDIAAVKGEEGLVVDAKSGRQRESDAWQVLVYLLALPLSWGKGIRWRGEVQYKGRAVDVRPLGKSEQANITSVLQTITDPTAEPRRVPSWSECRYCDVAACPERVTTEPTGDASELF